MTFPELPAPAGTASLGARLTGDGCRFALWAPRATRVELALVADDRSQHNIDLEAGPDGVWSGVVAGVQAEQKYGFRVHGAWDPASGQRFNPAKLLLDPYARAITAGVDYAGPIRDHLPDSDYEPDTEDSFAAVPLSVVVADSPPPPPVTRPTPMTESALYEVHVKGFTRLHPQVPEHLRGTYAGMAYPAVVQHLVDLGITAVELLPIHHFVSEPFLIGRGLTNYWGYNTLGFFAPHGAYCSVGTTGQQVQEFKDMVAAYHEAGIEVILDVVYNHSCEGGHEGPTLAFRGIDHAGYYRLTDDLRNDYDVTGCGNSIDSSQPGVLKLIMDSLRYWVTEMGVDGFRFDLATTLLRGREQEVDQHHPFKIAVANDPVLSKVKLIAEPWDLGPYGYQMGAFGSGWSEWNDHFRGNARDYWRGAVDGVRDLANRLSGSSADFSDDGRTPGASVNFIAAHDGFTLHDLVSYNGKHNEANGEGNRDGSDDNRSWNCGHEGETGDETVNALRHRQTKNLMTHLCLAIGTPMILAGDEFGRTQQGNNNAYCQDSPISWVHWDSLHDWADLLQHTQRLLQLRREHPVLRPDEYRHWVNVTLPDGTDTGRKELAWFSGDDGQMTDADWADGARRVLGMYTSNEDEAFLIWFNSSDADVQVLLPAQPWASAWELVLHTGHEHEFDGMATTPGDTLALPGRTCVVLQATLPDHG